MLCLTLAYPTDHQHYFDGHHGGYEHQQYQHEEPTHEYHHQIERVSLGDEHGYSHEAAHEVHEHEDEHVDYYVSDVLVLMS